MGLGKEASFRGAITETSNIKGYLGTPGELREENGNIYRLVRAGQTLADGVVLTRIGTAVPYEVRSCLSYAAPYCVNNDGTLAANTWFWGLVDGMGYVLVGSEALSPDENVGPWTGDVIPMVSNDNRQTP